MAEAVQTVPGSFVRPTPPEGTWVVFPPGTVARCPAPRCGRGIMRLFPGTYLWVRVAGVKHGPRSRVGHGLGGFFTCQNHRCGKQLEMEVHDR